LSQERVIPWRDPSTSAEGLIPPAPTIARWTWLPAVGVSTLLASLFLAWNPHVGDLAAQVFRTKLFESSGLAIWNGSWYGGHYTLTYSVLFPPLAALLGTRLLGALSVVASAYLFDRLVRARWGESAHWATVWFGFGGVSLLASGQLTFAFGVAWGLLCLYCLQRGRRSLALTAAAGCALASPVAATFLAGVVIAGAVGARRSWSAPVGAGAVALALVAGLNLVFPEGGRFPFVLSSFVAIPLWCAGALYLTRATPQERQFRTVVWAYLVGGTAAWLIPNPMGGNAIRLGALFGGPVLAAILLTRRPRVPPLAIAVVILGSLYWQVLPGIRAVARSSDDPSTAATYYRPVADWLRLHGGRRTRIEVPPTFNHWEAAYLAPRFDLARGWLRQLDSTRDDIFYKRHLSSQLYRTWLERNGVRYVAVPDARPDYSARGERELLLREPHFLRPRWTSAHWRVYEVIGARPLVFRDGNGLAQLSSLDTQSFVLNVIRPGTFTVRLRFTPYWSVTAGSGCISPAGHWTRLRAESPGIVRVSISVSPGRAWEAISHGHARCA
jgi:hypothetical protein